MLPIHSEDAYATIAQISDKSRVSLEKVQDCLEHISCKEADAMTKTKITPAATVFPTRPISRTMESPEPGLTAQDLPP